MKEEKNGKMSMFIDGTYSFLCSKNSLYGDIYKKTMCDVCACVEKNNNKKNWGISSNIYMLIKYKMTVQRNFIDKTF